MQNNGNKDSHVVLVTLGVLGLFVGCFLGGYNMGWQRQTLTITMPGQER